jgi:hypothetical protein
MVQYYLLRGFDEPAGDFSPIGNQQYLERLHGESFNLKSSVQQKASQQQSTPGRVS